MARTIDEQKIALSHLWYEIWMLAETSRKLNQGLGQFDFNVTIESFCLHARNLMDFLTNQKFPGDIKCSDFDIECASINLQKDIIQDAINKWASHLTWERVEGKKPSWPPSKTQLITDAIGKGIVEFINKLPDNLFPIPRYFKTKQDFFIEKQWI